MAEIQNTHRRIVLVHCDKSTTEHVLKTARELDLFNGEKIWILLDGLLGPEEKFDLKPLVQAKDYLPNGMLALQNRHRLIYDPELLDSIVELMGKAALNSYQKRILNQNGIKLNNEKSTSSKPFYHNNNNNANNNYRSTKYYSSSSFLNTIRAFHSSSSSSSSLATTSNFRVIVCPLSNNSSLIQFKTEPKSSSPSSDSNLLESSICVI